MRVFSHAVIVLAAGVLLSSCIQSHCCKTRSKACGELVLGRKCVGERGEKGPKERWRMYAGLGLEGIAIVAGSIGGGHYLLAQRRRDEAAAATGVGEKGFLLDQAEHSERVMTWSLGIAVSTAVVGGAVILWDVLAKEPGKDKQSEVAGTYILPTVGDGSAGLVIGTTF